MMSYIVLRGRWSNIIVLNVHEPSEEKRDDAITLSLQYGRMPKKDFGLKFVANNMQLRFEESFTTGVA